MCTIKAKSNRERNNNNLLRMFYFYWQFQLLKPFVLFPHKPFRIFLSWKQKKLHVIGHIQEQIFFSQLAQSVKFMDIIWAFYINCTIKWFWLILTTLQVDTETSLAQICKSTPCLATSQPQCESAETNSTSSHTGCLQKMEDWSKFP